MTDETNTNRDFYNEDGLPQVFCPWRRFLARTLDLSLYSTLWAAFLALALHVNIMTRGNGENILDAFVTLLLMLLLEPLWLRFFATTPGKAIFGLTVKDGAGRNLPYGEGLMRTWGVIGGMGYNIPIYNFIRLWRSYKACRDHKTQSWDDYITYTIKDKKLRRGLYYAAASAALIAATLTIAAAQLLPPNRGQLTVAQFVENHNYYATYYGLDFGRGGRDYLDESGIWREREKVSSGYYMEFGHKQRPEYRFVTEDGYVREVCLAVEERNIEGWLSPYDKYMIMTTLALAGAQPEMRLFSKLPKQIIAEIQEQGFQSFQFSAAGLRIDSKAEHSGFMPYITDFLVPQDGVADNYFRMNFSVAL